MVHFQSSVSGSLIADSHHADATGIEHTEKPVIVGRVHTGILHGIVERYEQVSASVEELDCVCRESNKSVC